jgi:hypothetical protein
MLQIPLQQETHFDEVGCCQNMTPLLTRNFILTRCLMKFPTKPPILLHDARLHRELVKLGGIWAQYLLLWRLQERMKEESDVRALIFNLL